MYEQLDTLLNTVSVSICTVALSQACHKTTHKFRLSCDICDPKEGSGSIHLQKQKNALYNYNTY